jgi:hypothetical protein
MHTYLFVISTWSYFNVPMILLRWISVGSDLKFDARRDLDDMGASCIAGMLFGSVNWSPMIWLTSFVVSCNYHTVNIKEMVLITDRRGSVSVVKERV